MASNSLIMAWISDHIPQLYMNVIKYPFHNHDAGSANLC